MVKWGIQLPQHFTLSDSLLASRFLDPEAPAHGLKIVSRYHGYVYDDLHATEDREALLDYCGRDTFVSAEILKTMLKDCTADQKKVLQTYFKIEQAFFGCEIAGLKLDTAKLQKEARRLTKEINAFVAGGVPVDLITNDDKFREWLFGRFSGKEEYLYKRLGRTESGELQISAKYLKLLKPQTKQLTSLMSAREVNNYYTLYVKRPLDIQKDGFFHPEYKLLVSKTQRRSTEPAIQNWPAKARNVVVSRFPDGKIIAADERNLEARLFAWQSGCKKFLEALVEGGYPLVAERCFGWERITKEDPRYTALKAMVLAVTYNMSVGLYKHNLEVDNGIAKSWDECERDYGEFFNTFPEIYDEIEARKAHAWKHGCIKSSIPGVRIPLPILPDYLFDTEKRYQYYRKKIENYACNYPTQCFASYVVGTALVDIQEYLAAAHGGWGSYIDRIYRTTGDDINQTTIWFPITEVHDELVIDSCARKVDEAREVVSSCMTEVRTLKTLIPKFDCPLETEMTIGDCWEKG